MATTPMPVVRREPLPLIAYDRDIPPAEIQLLIEGQHKQSEMAARMSDVMAELEPSILSVLVQAQRNTELAIHERDPDRMAACILVEREALTALYNSQCRNL